MATVRLCSHPSVTVSKIVEQCGKVKGSGEDDIAVASETENATEDDAEERADTGEDTCLILSKNDALCVFYRAAKRGLSLQPH